MTGEPVYYNEWDGFCAEWLENLMAASLIPAGDVDRRSIRDVQPSDLKGYRQCHFFAGIGGWPLALQLAGFPDDREVWTGSCPCQPFSAAGKRRGSADDRHLWPEFLRLIDARKPATVFGEQVASKDGRLWLAGVRADLEALAYEFGGADLCAAGVGKAHIRQRLFWVGHSGRAGSWGHAGAVFGAQAAVERGLRRQPDKFEPAGADGRLADSDGQRRGGLDSLLRESEEGRNPAESLEVARCGAFSGVADTCPSGRGALQWTSGENGRPTLESNRHSIPCLDGKTRRVEPGTFPLAHGVPARVGQLRAYGNAIVPALAAEFVKAFEDCRP